MKILLTGASGFIGSALADNFKGHEVVFVVRSKNAVKNKNCFLIDGFNGSVDFSECLKGVDVVVHCAARAHVFNNSSLSDFLNINTFATLKLAEQASKLGVSRFIFISSIGVNGSVTTQPFSEIDAPRPHNNYALSKYEAEKGLWDISSKANMEVVIIRPPLVYGPNPKGNFSTLLKLVKKNYPLPLSSVDKNKRSLIALENLVDFILLCADYKNTPQAANQTFVVSDGDDVSTADLLRRVAKAYGNKSRLFPFPVCLLCLGAKLLGKKEVVDRLLGSLQVDSSKARELLGWKPVVTMDEQLLKMARADGYPK